MLSQHMETHSPLLEAAVCTCRFLYVEIRNIGIQMILLAPTNTAGMKLAFTVICRPSIFGTQVETRLRSYLNLASHYVFNRFSKQSFFTLFFIISQENLKQNWYKTKIRILAILCFEHCLRFLR